MWLIGMMGSGKTTAGRAAAEDLGVQFADTDEFVADRMGCSVAQLWGSIGEAAFRDLERVAVSTLSEVDGIVATGGGVVLDDTNRQVLASSEKVIWLEASPETLSQRIESANTRPLLIETDQPYETELGVLLADRSILYKEVATHRIETDGIDAGVIVNMIEKVWQS